MLNLTPLTRPYFAFLRRRMEAVGNPAATEAVQRRLLATLLHTARATAVGEKYTFVAVASYDVFARRLPLVQYEDVRPEVMRMVCGEKNICKCIQS